MTIIKRKREDEKSKQIELMLFGNKLIIPANNTDRIFKCNTCNKEFKSFQALGGHRASHNYTSPNSVASGTVPEKSHECKICSATFSTGQALGGHMTIHRPKIESSIGSSSSKSDVIHGEKSVEEGTRGDNSALVTRSFLPVEPQWANAAPVEVVPVLERVDSLLELKLAPLGGDLSKNKD